VQLQNLKLKFDFMPISYT